MRVAVLCNDRIALPAMDQLFSARLAVAIGMPERMHEAKFIVKGRCDHYKVPFYSFTKKNLAQQITAWLHEHRPDVVLVKTFPYLIPGEVMSIPKYGFINFHYAPLPHWRGPNPLFWMIRSRTTTGGVTVHRMNASYDAGPVLLQQPVNFSSDTSFGFFYTQLAYVGANLTGPLLHGLTTGNLKEKEQDHSQAKWYGHPQPSDLMIDWNTMNAEDIIALIKACNPWNKGAGTRWKGWTFGITYASLLENSSPGNTDPGTVLSVDSNGGLVIACKEGKAIRADIIYCEEGFYPGHCMAAFGLHRNERLQ